MASTNSDSSRESSITYKLKVPLVQGDHVVSELHFRQPKLKHLKKLDGAKGNFEIMSLVLVHLCDIRPGLVDELDPRDFDDIGKIIEGFFPKSQET
jgi:hypothetical protein